MREVRAGEHNRRGRHAPGEHAGCPLPCARVELTHIERHNARAGRRLLQQRELDLHRVIAQPRLGQRAEGFGGGELVSQLAIHGHGAEGCLEALDFGNPDPPRRATMRETSQQDSLRLQPLDMAIRRSRYRA